MVLNIEIVVDRRMYAEKALGGSCRFKPLHLALSSSHYLMRILRPIVASKPLLMRAGQPQMPECRAIGAQLVSNQQFRCKALFLEQLAHQPQRCALVAPGLNQHVEDFALVIYRSPQIHSPAGDPNHHLVEHS